MSQTYLEEAVEVVIAQLASGTLTWRKLQRIYVLAGKARRAAARRQLSVKDRRKEFKRFRTGLFRQLEIRDGVPTCANDSCVRDGTPIEIDHRTPIVAGGDNSLSNLQFLCRTCNRKKFTSTSG